MGRLAGLFDTVGISASSESSAHEHTPTCLPSILIFPAHVYGLSMLRRRILILFVCSTFVLAANLLGKLKAPSKHPPGSQVNEELYVCVSGKQTILMTFSRQEDSIMNVQSRLKAMLPTAQELMKISGSAGISIGVLHHGEVVFTANEGYQDVTNKIQPTSDTLYWTGSITKSVTAAAIGALVEEGKLEWKSVVSEILVDFKHQNQEIREKLDITDILSHRSGLGGKAALWQRDHARVVIALDDFVKTTTYLPAVYELRKVWMPSNWNYGLADRIVAKASGTSFGTYLRDTLFKPLQLHRTTIDIRPELDNVAEGYFCSGSEDPPYLAGKPQVGEGSIMAGAMGLKSSVNDLLTYFRAFMHA